MMFNPGSVLFRLHVAPVYVWAVVLLAVLNG